MITSLTLPANACSSAPSVNTTAETTMTILRPHLSAILLPMMDPTKAPTSAELTIDSSSYALRKPRSWWIVRSAPETTPVSYPLREGGDSGQRIDDESRASRAGGARRAGGADGGRGGSQ